MFAVLREKNPHLLSTGQISYCPDGRLISRQNTIGSGESDGLSKHMVLIIV